MKKTTFFLLVVVLMWTTMAFDCDDPPPPPPEGFTIRTDLGFFAGRIPTIMPVGDVNIFGVRETDAPGATGTRTQLPSFATTDDDGLYPVPDGRAPATWRIGEFSGPCKDQEKLFPVERGKTVGVICDTTGFFVPRPGSSVFIADPAFIDLDTPPATVTVTGSGIDATYGMPYVEYYDQNGTLVAQEQASQVSPDGTSLTGPAPNPSGVTSNSYWLIVSNVSADGSLQFAGAVNIYIGSLQLPPPRPDPCGQPLELPYRDQMEQPLCTY